MLEELLALLPIVGLPMGLLVLRVIRDRREDAELRLQATLQRRANQRLGGESVLVVTVRKAWRGERGRVVLSTPDHWHWLVDEVWNEMRAATPAGYDLVVAGRLARHLEVPVSSHPSVVARPAPVPAGRG